MSRRRWRTFKWDGAFRMPDSRRSTASTAEDNTRMNFKTIEKSPIILKNTKTKTFMKFGKNSEVWELVIDPTTSCKYFSMIPINLAEILPTTVDRKSVQKEWYTQHSHISVKQVGLT